MIAMFNGQPIFGPRGPSGPDGNPIGTIISYMGTKAPTDYLICDGSIYNISDYSNLAEFFKTQFGAENYFGGDGATTFSVPDLRNLFLRGYHGAAGEQLSGEIGKKQDATQIPYTHADYDGYVGAHIPNVGRNIIEKYDTAIMREGVTYVGGGAAGSSGYRPYALTPRPVNMAVLYCIKATAAELYENVYSTEETVIGTWIDGRPVYRRVFKGYTEKYGEWKAIGNIPGAVVCSMTGYVSYNGVFPGKLGIPNDSFSIGVSDNGDVCAVANSSAYVNKEFCMIVEYIKTTDTGVST